MSDTPPGQQRPIFGDVAAPRTLSGDARDVARRRKRRAAARDLTIPDIENPARRARCESDLRAFAETYFSDLFYLPWSDDHLEMLTDLQRTLTKGGRALEVADRGKGKSTITVVATVWAICYGHRRFPVIICDTHANTKDRLDTIRMIFETNDCLAEDFPGPCHCARALEGKYQRAKGQTVNGELTHMSWGGYDRLIFPTLPDCASSGAIVAARSMTSSIRGLQQATAEGEMRRPDFVLLDDPIDDEAAHSETRVDKHEETILQVAMNLGGPDTTMSAVYLGTIIREDDLTSRFMDRAEWRPRKYQLFRQMPENMDAWDSYNDVRVESYEEHGDLRKATAYYREHRADLDAGAEVSWPHRIRKDEGEISAIQTGMDLYFEEGRDVFMAEYQNDPPSLEEEALMVLGSHRIETKDTGLERGVIPDNALALALGIDVGKYGLHWAAGAVAPGRIVSIVDYGVEEVLAPTGRIEPDDTTKRAAFEQALMDALRRLRDKMDQDPYRMASRQPMRPALALVDSRYEQPVVEGFCAEASVYFPVQGRGTARGQKNWYVPKGKKAMLARDGNCYRTIERHQWIYTVHSDAYKQIVHTGWLLDSDAPGSIATFQGEHRNTHHSFARHVTAEIQREVSPGIYAWRKARGRAANHWLDACCYLMAAVSLLEHRIPAIGLSGADTQDTDTQPIGTEDAAPARTAVPSEDQSGEPPTTHGGRKRRQVTYVEL